MADQMTVEVVFALPDVQSLRTISLPKGSTVADAVAQSGLIEAFSEHKLSDLPVGIWGRPADKEQPVRDGDRIEIYRPLEIDPREERRQLAEAGRTMGNSPRN